MKAIFFLGCFLFFIFEIAFTLPKKLVKNWQYPGNKELEVIQQYLKHEFGSFTNKTFPGHINRFHSFKIYDGPSRDYSLKRMNFCKDQDKQDHSICIVCYTTINKKYEAYLKDLLEFLRKKNFRGDVLYRNGGWPNMENGGILVCDTPYAFQISALMEARKLGYKQALWLDSRILILQPLDSVFEKISKNGPYFRKSSRSLKGEKTITKNLADSLGTSLEALQNMPHCATGILGADFSNPIICRFFDEWYNLALKRTSFISRHSGQIPFTFLVHKYGLWNCRGDDEDFVNSYSKINKSTIFWINTVGEAEKLRTPKLLQSL